MSIEEPMSEIVNSSVEHEQNRHPIISFHKSKDDILLYLDGLPLIDSAHKNMVVGIQTNERGDAVSLFVKKLHDPTPSPLVSFDTSPLVGLDIPQDKDDVALVYGFIPFRDIFITLRGSIQNLRPEVLYGRKEDVVEYITETLRKISILCNVLGISLERNIELAQWTQELLCEKDVYTPEEYITHILHHIDTILAGRRKELLPKALQTTPFSKIFLEADFFDYRNQVLEFGAPRNDRESSRKHAKKKALVSFFLTYCSLQDRDMKNPQALQGALMDFPYGYKILEIYQTQYYADTKLNALDSVLFEACRTAPVFDYYNFTPEEWVKKFKK